jgi:hypothetical protein
MSERWAAALPIAHAAHLGRFRLRGGIEVCQQGETLWLSGNDLEAVDVTLRGLPDVRRFRCLQDDQLIELEQRVPSHMLPAGTWVPLGAWLKGMLPQCAWPGQAPPKIALRLERAVTPQEPTLLELPLPAWQAYVATAPQVRLDRLSFALDSRKRVLVRGTPLPPLAGRRFVEFDGIAVPIGWHWTPAVDAQTVRQCLQLDSHEDEALQTQGELGKGRGDLALLTSEDCQWERIPGDAFVQATRSAVRLSAEASDVSA